MKQKLSVMIVSLLLFVSFFAVSVIAEETNGEDIESSDVVSSDEVEVLEEEEIEDILPDLEEELAELKKTEVEDAERGAIFKITHVTISEGFILSGDESNAEFFRGFWSVRRFIEKAESSQDIENKAIKSKKVGSVVIGAGPKKEIFKLEMIDFDSDGASFDLKNKDNEVIGSLDITPKRYDRITLWFGKLSIDSGAYVGKWSVTAAVKTKIIKPRIKRPAAWNIFAFNKRKEANIKEKAQEKILEREGLGKFAKEISGKNLKDINKKERKVVINKVKRNEIRVAQKAKFKIKSEREEIKEKLKDKDNKIKIRKVARDDIKKRIGKNPKISALK